MPTLRAAAAFCFDLINNDTHLLLAPGSLMIDVFIRQVVVVGVLSHFCRLCLCALFCFGPPPFGVDCYE